ncbi:MAG TPA: methylmalonyl-CoA epimerase [Chloroflexota bacterium]|nr:methylmalonyl-CoA epimerase [Chloroflexota bacterium]
MIQGIDHIGVAVKDLAQRLALYRDVLGLAGIHVEEVPTEDARVGFVPLGETAIELLESTAADGVLARFIEKRGEGVHHIALKVDDCAAALTKLQAAGLRTLDNTPRPGARGTKVGFVHPSSTGGVLLELVERPTS